jgi:hypothetical protein
MQEEAAKTINGARLTKMNAEFFAADEHYINTCKKGLEAGRHVRTLSNGSAPSKWGKKP